MVWLLRQYKPSKGIYKRDCYCLCSVNLIQSKRWLLKQSRAISSNRPEEIVDIINSLFYKVLVVHPGRQNSLRAKWKGRSIQSGQAADLGRSCPKRCCLDDFSQLSCNPCSPLGKNENLIIFIRIISSFKANNSTYRKA